MPELSASAAASSWLEIDRFVAAYESRRARRDDAEIRDYLPAREHADYLSVLRELVRVDLEYAWERGQARRPEDYFAQFPELQADRQSVQEIGFEDYRLRRQAGENPCPAEYRQRFGVDTRDWPVELPDSDRRSEAAQGAGPASADGLEQAATLYLQQYRLKAGPETAAASAPPDYVYRLARALTLFPPEGVDFLGFHLVKELGRGAFSRVYLAHQGELAGRFVALKISSDVAWESQTLARLQHTHIVPIYSVHRVGPFQAICMPFLGATTLCHVAGELGRLGTLPQSGAWLSKLLRDRGAEAGAQQFTLERTYEGTLALLERSTYVDGVIWMGQQLAEALAHAHERGILHGDLKPANILLSDEGLPMLLDFNLSEDARLRSNVSAAYIGGTLPYMAPEHLEAFRANRQQNDARSDVYAMGVILYELLTGRYPFPLRQGPPSVVLEQMIDDRRGWVPSLRCWNRSVSPACESIVRHCLEADPAKRYQSAAELHIDLQRQRMNLPLRYAQEMSWPERLQKWVRRHPVLTSSYSVGAVAGLLLLVLASLYFMRWRELNQRRQELISAEALNTLHQFRDELKTSQFLLCTFSPDLQEIREGMELSGRALDRYQALDESGPESAQAWAALPGQERDQLREELTDLLLLRAQGASVQALGQPASPHRDKELEEALRLNERAQGCAGGKAALRLVRLQRASLLDILGRKEEARSLREEAAALPLQSARDLYLAGSEQMARKEYGQALALLDKANHESPQDGVIWYAMGLCHARMGQHQKAAACLGTSVALWPAFYGHYFHRGLAHLELKEYEQAVADFSNVIQRRSDYCYAWANRALARAGMKDYAAAIADVTHALDETSEPPTRLYFMRSVFRANAGDVQGARADLAEGLRRRPTDALSWATRAVHRLADDPRAALSDCDEALKLEPELVDALQTKAHILSEKLGRTAEAAQALDQALQHNPNHVPARAGRGVLLARLKRRPEALRDASRVLELDRQPSTLYQVACIYALTSRQQKEDGRVALRLLSLALAGGYGQDLLKVDTDLDPIRPLPEFGRLIEVH
jgi:serine/threonine protein kinase/Tfp pilus assembly protein PilF